MNHPPSETSAWRAVVRVLRSTPLSAFHAVSTVLLPSPCRLCGDPLLELTAVPVCSPCWTRLHPQSDSLCSRCGESLGTAPISDSNTTQTLCRACRMAQPPFARAVAFGVYHDELRALLHLLKYDRIESVSHRLGALLAQRVLAVPDLPHSMLVVPVPLHRSRRRTRGFNQAEHLARALAGSLHRQQPQLRIQLAPGALARRRATESQAGLTPRQRRANLRGAFFISGPKAQRAVAGRHVLLVDDIYTTGATARACSRALMRAGAASVLVATVARAQRHQPLHPQVLSAPAEETPAHTELPMHQDVAFWGTATIQNG